MAFEIDRFLLTLRLNQTPRSHSSLPFDACVCTTQKQTKQDLAPATIFDKIMKKEIPADVVYECVITYTH